MNFAFSLVTKSQSIIDISIC